MAAGMDAQHMEAKLEADVNKAEAAWLVEKDPANKAGLWLLLKDARDELKGFRRQQVAGGKDPNQGCKVGLARCATACNAWEVQKSWDFATLLHSLQQSGTLCLTESQVCSCFTGC